MLCLKIERGAFPIELHQQEVDQFSVRYGRQWDTDLIYAQACVKLGQAILHSLACDAMIDNRELSDMDDEEDPAELLADRAPLVLTPAAQKDRAALLEIQQAMSGARWTPETLEAIAEVMERAGYKIEDLNQLPTPGPQAE